MIWMIREEGRESYTAHETGGEPNRTMKDLAHRSFSVIQFRPSFRGVDISHSIPAYLSRFCNPMEMNGAR